MRFFAIVQNCFRKILDRKLFWVCLILTILSSTLFLFVGFHHQEQVDHEQVSKEILRKVISKAVQPFSLEKLSFEKKNKASLRIKSPLFSPKKTRYFLYYFSPDQIKNLVSAAGLQKMSFKGDPKLILQKDSRNRSTISIPLKIWNRHRVPFGVLREGRIQNLDPSVPDSILNDFPRSVRKALTSNSTEEKPSFRISITANISYQPRVNPKDVPGLGKINLFFGAVTLDVPEIFTIRDCVLLLVQRPVIDYLVGVVGIILSIVLTANFIPRMLQSGEIELSLSKSVSRWQLFLGTFLGASLFFALIAAVFLLLSSFFLYIRSGIFTGFMLISFVPLMIMFFLIYSISALIGTLFENNILAMMAAFGGWFFMFLIEHLNVGAQQIIQRDQIQETNNLYQVLDLLDTVIPSPDKIHAIVWKWMVKLGVVSEWVINVHFKNTLERFGEISVFNTILTTAGCITLFLSLSIVLFYRKEI